MARATSAHDPVLNRPAGTPAQRHRRQRHGVGHHHNARAGQHRPRIIASRILHLARNRRGVVPAHVVPHRHQNRRVQAPARRALCRHTDGPAKCMPCQTATATSTTNGDSSSTNKRHRSVAHRGRAQQVPQAANRNQPQLPRQLRASPPSTPETAAPGRAQTAWDKSPCRRCSRSAKATLPGSPRTAPARAAPTHKTRPLPAARSPVRRSSAPSADSTAAAAPAAGSGPSR